VVSDKLVYFPRRGKSFLKDLLWHNSAVEEFWVSIIVGNVGTNSSEELNDRAEGTSASDTSLG